MVRLGQLWGSIWFQMNCSTANYCVKVFHVQVFRVTIGQNNVLPYWFNNIWITKKGALFRRYWWWVLWCWNCVWFLWFLGCYISGFWGFFNCRLYCKFCIGCNLASSITIGFHWKSVQFNSMRWFETCSGILIKPKPWLLFLRIFSNLPCLSDKDICWI